MRIKVNGEWQDRPDGETLAELVAALGLHPQRVAVELNKQIAPRGSYGQTRLADQDTLEIVTLVGGGQKRPRSSVSSPPPGPARGPRWGQRIG